MKLFKKFLSIFLINLLVFYQVAFYIPPVFAQGATESATVDSTEELLPEPSISPTPAPTEESTPSASAEPTPSPESPLESSPSATPVPSPTPGPSPEIINGTVASSSASLSNNSVRPVTTEKKIKKISSKNYVEGQVLVKFRENKINLKQSNSVTKAEQFAEAKNLDLEETIEKSNVAVLETKGESVEGAIDRLENDSSVQYAEPNYIRTPATISTNDTFKDRLWGLDNTGQSVDGVPGTNDADMDSPESWGISEGNSNIIVAIIDSGVDYNHPDLQANMWDGTSCKDENGVALNNCNHGYDFADNDKTPLPSNSSHGTHLAGTIAAVKNNSKGIIGVAPSVKIMALKYGDDVASEVRAIDFAIQNGAKIINASFAGSFSQTEYDAINRFKTAGGIFVTVAGNETVNNDAGTHSYPSDYDLDNIISVTATDQSDTLADFSNYGVTSVDVAAPGVNIYSTIADLISTEVLNEPFTSVVPPALPSGWVKTGNWGTYDFGDQIWGKVLYGNLGLPYPSNANSTVTSATYNLSGASGANIEFWAACDTEYITDGWHDYMALEVSSNGTDFTEVMKWDEAFLDDDLIENNNGTNGITVDYLTQSIPTNYFTSNFVFRLRWVTDADGITGTAGDGCKVDDILITKYTLGSSELYEYKDGTSMAAPHVAGLAALIWSYNSSRTYSQVKSIILNTGDAKTSLNGKTVSGKRVNANNALLATNGPVIAGLSNDTSSTKSKTWNWSSTDSTATFRFAIDQSSSWTPIGDYSSTVTATQGSGNATYYIHVQAKNSSGIESEVITVSAVIDNTAPTVPGTPIPSPSSPTNQTTQTWNWTASTDNIAGTITYLWSIINAATSTLFDTGTTTSTSLVTNLLQGVWNLIVNAKDNAGNQSATATGSVIVDTTVSTGSITAPVNNSSHNVIPAFTASASDVNTAVSSVKFQYKANSDSTFTDLNTDTVAPYQANWTDVTLTTNTTYNLQVVITDSAGNTSTVSGVSFIYDATAPNAPSIPDLAATDDTGTSNSDNITNQTTGLTFSGTAEANSTVELFDGITSRGTTTATGGNWSFDITLVAGTHSLTAKTTDVTGNISVASDALNVTIETTAPDAPTSVNLTNPINNSNKTAVTLTGTGEANASINYTISDADNVHTVSGIGTVTGNGSISITNIDVSTLSDGAITASATLTDAVGNTSPVGTDTTPSTKDVVAPSAPTVNNISTDNKINNSEKAAIVVAGTAEANSLVSVTLSDGTNSKSGTQQLTGGGTSFSITIDGTAATPGALVDGSITPSVTATDAAGNASSATSSPTAIQDTVAPTGAFTINNAAAYTNSTGVTLNFSGVSSDVTQIQIADGDSVFGTNATYSNSYSYTLPNTQGTRTVQVKLIDGAGNISGIISDAIILDSVNPVIAIYTLDNIRISPQASVGIKDTALIDLAFSEQVSADVDILNSLGTKVLDFYDSASVTNPQAKEWDGKDSSVNYVPEGIYTIRVVITDQAGNSITDTSKTVTVNNAPLSLNPIGNKSVNEGSELIFTAQADDEEGGILTFSLAGAPTGAIINSSTGAFSWTPTEAQGEGSYTFTVSVSSTTGTNVSEEIVVTVNEVNIAPIASDSTQTTDEDVAKVITLSATDADLPANTLIYSIVSGPSHGTLSAVSGNSVTYTPAANYNGLDSFTFRVNDGSVNSNTATINITVNAVNDIPVASNGLVTIDEDDVQSITMVANDADGAGLTYIIVSNPTSGSLSTLNSTAGTVTYTPNLNFNGSDSFTFKVNDGTVDSNTATTTINITAVNDPPVLSSIGNKTVNELVNLTFTATATDPDNSLTYSLTSAPSGAAINSNTGVFSFTPTEVQGPDNFTLTVNATDGTNTDSEEITITVSEVNTVPVAQDNSVSTNEDIAKVITLSATDADLPANTLIYSIVSGVSHGVLGSISGNQLTYTPASNYNGSDSLTFRVNDGTTNGNTATVSLTVDPVNDAPMANNDTASVNEDAVLTIAKAILVADDTDVDGDTLTVSAVSNSVNGSVSINGDNIIFTPTANYFGSASFDYTVSDGTLTNTGTVAITVTPVNDAPFANDGSATTNEDTLVTIDLSGSDIEGNSLTYSIVTGTSEGTLGTISGNHLTYTPPNDYNGSDSFTFKVNDGNVDSNTATVTINVTPVNDAPVALDDASSTNEDAAVIIEASTLLANDTDVDSTPTITAVSNAVNGSVSLSGTDITLTPATNFNGIATFEYTVSDGSLTDIGLVSVTVTAVNDVPTITVASPNGGEIWAGDSSHDITWNASDIDNASEDLVIDLYYTTNDTDFTEIGTGLTNTGDYTWDPVDSLNSSTVKIKAVVTDPDDATETDLSNANFTIDSTAPTIPGTPSTSPNPTNSTSQIWNWSVAIDDGSGVANYLWSLTGGQDILSGSTTATSLITNLIESVWTFFVNAVDNVGNQSDQASADITVDTTAPTVTTGLGDGLTDKILSVGDANLTFSEVLSDSSKTAVENALTAGADKALTYTWDANQLLITVSEETTFANDVVVSVSDLAGNSAELLIVDSVLSSTQKAPDESGDVTIDDTNSEVVITDPDQEVDITIDSGTDNPTIDVSSFITGGTGTLPKITIDSEKADIAIPASTVVTSADTTWNGVIAAPTVTTVTLPETAGETKTLSTAIEIGFSGAKLSFDKAVKILLPGQAGKRAGYVRTGITFTEITSICAADNQVTGDGLVADGDCKIDAANGLDLVIWTKHFTKFASYTQTTSSSSSSSSGGSLSTAGAPSCNDVKPGSAPTLVSAVAGTNSVTLTWLKAASPVTYYLVNYSTTSGVFQYGNPNVGGPDTTSYTVSGLSGNTTYYFKVRAGNGCAPGDYSNEISATPGGVFIAQPAAGFVEGVLGVTTDDDQQDEEKEAQEGVVEGVETTFTEEGPQQELGSFVQRNWPWIAVVILIISGTAYYLFNRRR